MNTASKARRLILRNNKIISRYYALDKNGKSTHNNAELTNNAIQGLFDDKFYSSRYGIVFLWNNIHQMYLLPSHASMVHGFIEK